MEKTTQEMKFSAPLDEAIQTPGIIGKYYSAFHRYSIGNQFAAIVQCMIRGIEIGPLASFMTWKEKGRSVKKGSKAIELCMPITRKVTKENQETGEAEELTFQRFIWKKNWFVLSQTDGVEYAEETATPTWNADKALSELSITRTVFDLLDGNCQGFARKRSVAISPVAAFPIKTMIHEIAHIVLGHTAEVQMADDERTPRNLREVEAEGVAYILTDMLGLSGKEESRGYIQNWLKDEAIPEKSAQKIFATADKIYKAGGHC
jgi:hypothetical protein